MRNVQPWNSFRARIDAVHFASPVQGDHLLLLHTGLTHGTLLADAVHLQPTVQTRPAEQMPAEGDHGVLSKLQANVAVEASALVAGGRAAGRGRLLTSWAEASCRISDSRARPVLPVRLHDAARLMRVLRAGVSTPSSSAGVHSNRGFAHARPSAQPQKLPLGERPNHHNRNGTNPKTRNASQIARIANP